MGLGVAEGAVSTNVDLLTTGNDDICLKKELVYGEDRHYIDGKS